MTNKSCIFYDKFAFKQEDIIKSYASNKYIIQQELASMLLNYEKIAFRVYGANLPIAILVDIFGLSGLHELLEQQAIEFIFNNSETCSFSSVEEKDKRRIAKATSNEPLYKDPETSIAAGIACYQKFVDRKEKRSLSRKILKQYKVLPENIVDEAISFAENGYSNNLFKDNDLPRKNDIRELSSLEASKLQRLTNLAIDYAIVSKNKYHSLNNTELMVLNKSHSLQLKNAQVIETYSDKSFSIENLPNFKELLTSGLIDLDDVIKLRAKRNSIKFRDWLNNLDESTVNNFDSKEYIDEITKKGFWAEGAGKFIKTTGIFSISAAITAPLGFLPATTFGAISTLIDSYLIDSYINGWNPRYFFDKEIRPLIKG